MTVGMEGRERTRPGEVRGAARNEQRNGLEPCNPELEE